MKAYLSGCSYMLLIFFSDILFVMALPLMSVSSTGPPESC